MITTLSTQDPDNPGNNIQVTVDWAHVPVTGVSLFRKDVEGNSRALNADVTFGAAAGVPAGATDFDVEIDVQTERHTVPMRAGLPITSPADLQGTWDMQSTSGGDGNIMSVTVRTIVR